MLHLYKPNLDEDVVVEKRQSFLISSLLTKKYFAAR